MAGRRGPTRREEMIMTQDKARKAATRQRMAETGEPYSVARRAVIAGTLSSIATFVLFYLMTVFALSWATTALGYNRTTFLLIQLFGIAFFAIFIPVENAAHVLELDDMRGRLFGHDFDGILIREIIAALDRIKRV